MFLGVVCLFHAVCLAVNPSSDVRFQAHRGGLGEFPEHTLAAYTASWDLNAIPEIDLRTSKDGVFICLHDESLERTTNAPEDVKRRNVSELTLDEIRKWDAGVRFSPEYAGQKVPTLEEVFRAMQNHPEREIYIDYKSAELASLAALIEKFGVAKQVIFCYNKYETCLEMRKQLPGMRIMIWIGGTPQEIRDKFSKIEAAGFQGLDQVQLHLAPVKGSSPVAYMLPIDFIKFALERTRDKKIDLEVLPFAFDDASLASLLDAGIRWFATDHPKRFRASVEKWESAVK